MTVTLNPQVTLLPDSSDAVKVTAVVPTGKTVPKAGFTVIVTLPVALEIEGTEGIATWKGMPAG